MSEAAKRLDDLPAGMQAFTVGSNPLGPIASVHEPVLAGLAEFDPLRLAATFSGLLTVPELQSNCVRLEALVHLTLALGRGKRKPNERLISRRQEDPAEDVFVSSISTQRRDTFAHLVEEPTGRNRIERINHALQIETR
jgi:hypothetical protein